MTHDPRPDIVLEGSFDKAHEKRYAHVPFQVPPGVHALHVRIDYSDCVASDVLLSGGNTLDIGLFDARGIAPSSPGFRGWSGSNKLSFSITEAWATPPYIPGPIPSGTWHVLLGPYKIGPRGCVYRVEISFGDVPGEPEPRPAQAHPAAPTRLPPAEPGWLRGDLHCHTLHSDGDSWPADMLATAVETGLEFLGVTDHNTTSHHADYARVTGDPLPILLPGIEVTTYRGHWNAWGTDTWWEFREAETESVRPTMRAAAASGALVSVNHPKPFGPPWEYGESDGYHAIEVWNGEWTHLNCRALEWWEVHLRRGERTAALGGSDTHHLKTRNGEQRDASRLGYPTTWAYVGSDRSAQGVLGALRAGRAFISRGPEGPQLYFRCGPVLPGGTVPADQCEFEVRVRGAPRSTLVLLSARGAETAAVVTRDDWFESFKVPPHAPAYLRAQLVDERGNVLALTNPLYFAR
jgi:hypothetical protein